jgi:hypothetical protein
MFFMFVTVYITLCSTSFNSLKVASQGTGVVNLYTADMAFY